MTIELSTVLWTTQFTFYISLVYNIFMNKSSTKRAILERPLLIKRNYLIFLGYHYLDMPIKDLERVFGIKKQSIFNVLEESDELQKK